MPKICIFENSLMFAVGYLSDQGLEETKNAFSKESPDLLGRDLDNHMNEGRKLSLIIKEYFKLKGNGKMSVDFLV